MPVDEVQGPSAQLPRHSDPPSTSKAPSSGISAVAVKDGAPVSIYVDNHWQPVSRGAPELQGVPLSSLQEYDWVGGLGWAARDDARKADPAVIDNGRLQASGKNLPIIAIDGQELESPDDRQRRLEALPPGVHEFTVLDGAKPVVIGRTIGAGARTVDDPGTAERANINDGHLQVSDKKLPIIAIDGRQPENGVDREHMIAALSPGSHKFTVLDGAKFIDVVRSVGSPAPAVALSQSSVVHEPAGAPVERPRTGPSPERLNSGIQREAAAFKGPKAIGAAATQVLAEMLRSPNQDAWQEQFVPLLGQIRDHQRLTVPHPLIEKVVAKLSPALVHRYGRKHVEAAVRQFIEGAARRINTDAGQ
jgi:hypothetical protein